jgi:hypothetical protein
MSSRLPAGYSESPSLYRQIVTLAISSGLLFMCAMRTTEAGSMDRVPFDADHWTIDSPAGLSDPEGFPLGMLTLPTGVADLKGVRFSQGTIEFDMKPIEEGIAGIRFHRKDAATAELVYLRAGSECPASNDCIQYAPITHGLMQWDIYPQFQNGAPVSEHGWNHVRLIVARHRLMVYINGQSSPALDVDRLRGDAETGGIELSGPAVYANLAISSDIPAHLPPSPPSTADRGIIHAWEATKPEPLPADKTPTAADIPVAGPVWEPATTEDNGLVNLSHMFGSPTAPTPAISWLKTTVQSDRDRDVGISLGWCRRVWVFVNGDPVYSGSNGYYPESERKSPDGRLSLENQSIRLSLHKGNNAILLAIGNRWETNSSRYGWGVRMRLDDVRGLTWR